MDLFGDLEQHPLQELACVPTDPGQGRADLGSFRNVWETPLPLQRALR